MAVFRSSKYLQIQLIDDEKGKTIFGFTDRRMEGKTKTERARAMGKEAAKRIAATGIKEAVFDRGGHRYQGRVKALAEALREGGVIL